MPPDRPLVRLQVENAEQVSFVLIFYCFLPGYLPVLLLGLVRPTENKDLALVDEHAAVRNTTRARSVTSNDLFPLSVSDTVTYLMQRDPPY